jgi:MFS family permease
LQLAGSGFALGITNALQFGPLVFLGLYGVIADRFDRRRLLIVTQGTPYWLPQSGCWPPLI